jgi:hypothetical protein
MASKVMLPVISEFILTRRIGTLCNAINNANMDKFHRVADNTVDTINKRARSEVHDDNLAAYIKNVELAQLLCFCDCQDAALKYLALANDVIERDLAVMTPTYVFATRLQDEHGNHDSLGSLADLPNGVLWNIASFIKST